MATSLDGISSDPVTLVVNVNDINDNSPSLTFPDKTVKIQDGRVLEPFLLKINDKDSNDVNHNIIIFVGSAAKFLSPELVSSNVYRIQISGVPEIGGYILDIVAKDLSNKELKESRKSLKIEVLNSAGKARFAHARYERKISFDKLHTGNPLIQLQFNGEAIENIQFVFLDGNPGWLAIEDFGGNVFVGDVPKDGVSPGDYTVTVAALERQTQQIIDRCEISLNIEGTQISKSMFNAKVFSITVPKEVEKNVVIEPLQKNEKREMNLISDSIYAWGDSMEIVHIPSDIIKIESDSVIINALALQNLRGLQ
uniref:Cadherin domain-containing protein n=1 Tax=Panagrolaimus sp. PS1159 TaxID=55785 RepID=A0AC35EVR3_9BILA